MIYIYGLINERTNELIYVGKTRNPESRMAQHGNGTGLLRNIRDKCRMEILEYGEHVSSCDEFFWIEYMRFLGCSLRNRRTKYSDAEGQRYDQRVPQPKLPRREKDGVRITVLISRSLERELFDAVAAADTDMSKFTRAAIREKIVAGRAERAGFVTM